VGSGGAKSFAVVERLITIFLAKAGVVGRREREGGLMPRRLVMHDLQGTVSSS